MYWYWMNALTYLPSEDSYECFRIEGNGGVGKMAKSGLSCWSFARELGYMFPVLLTQETIGLEIGATWWVRWALALRTIKGQTSHLTLHNSPWLGFWTLPSGSWPSALPYGTCPQTHWHFMAPNYLHWMIVHQGSCQPSPSWDSSVVQGYLFDYEDVKTGSKQVSGLCHSEAGQCWWQRDSQARERTVRWREDSHMREAESVRWEVSPGQKQGGFLSLLPPLSEEYLLQVRSKISYLVLSSVSCTSAPLLLLPCSSPCESQRQPYSGFHDYRFFFANQKVA